MGSVDLITYSYYPDNLTNLIFWYELYKGNLRSDVLCNNWAGHQRHNEAIRPDRKETYTYIYWKIPTHHNISNIITCTFYLLLISKRYGASIMKASTFVTSLSIVNWINIHRLEVNKIRGLIGVVWKNWRYEFLWYLMVIVLFSSKSWY